jgi:hypothetical protein
VTVEPAPDPDQEPIQTEQTVEGIQQRAVEDAPPADEAEVQTHDEHPAEKKR